MSIPQPGIFALGTASHAYLEFDGRDEAAARALVAAVAQLREPRTTMGGVNLVAGFRPELWRTAAPGEAPEDVVGFDRDLVGPDGYLMPATQHDATENPSLIDAPDIALIPEGSAGAGGTVLLLQKWVHDVVAWESLTVARQEQVIGRAKSDSTELEDKPADSHVSSTDQDEFGKIFRRNMPYGTVTDHGTMFVGFSADQRRLASMLESMAGATDGTRDALTRYTRPVTGAYYFVPSTEALRQYIGTP